ncbi:coiled-coil domain-containing protein 7 isoform X2 [Peromyscus leucopus]|uniref:coiled-coil domain-containing protein 7 isoform X2 n=1 Tax=Peromyscus leucopus TaxID=10041 RepID=UPI001884B4B1|nr:coiled-coil domain-containing protein 7 isoform X2 [Peromyscus leucopus]
MKRAKHLSTTSKKLTSVPELPFKKGLLNSSPKLKEKRNTKPLHDKTEPMVLRSPPTGESIVRYALPIPSSKTKDLIAEDEMVRRIAKHLKTVVTALEDTYGAVDEDGEKTPMKPKADGVSLSVGDDMNSFLLCCSQFAAQLEEAVKEERNILESLFKWFQQQVNQMEEIGKDQSILEADLPSDDKSVHSNIAQIANLVHKFEDLKSRLREHKGSLVSKYVDKETPSVPVKTYEGVEKQIEDFIKSHSTFESQVDSETEPEAPYSVTDRMNVMMNIFKNQTNMLERALNDQSIIETKYKQMEADFQVLLVEKTLLEGEIRRLRESEKAKPAGKEERSKKPAKPEKKKDKDSERKTSPSREIELIEIQKEAEALKMEKKALQEQLKWALQEAERNKTQLDIVLHQEMEVFKEEKSKTKLDRVLSKSKVKGETSKSTEKVPQPGKISPEKGKSLERRRSISADLDPSALEGFYGVSDVSAFPQEVFKSFTALPFIEERLESGSPLPKEMKMWSLVSFPDLAKEIEKAEASEQMLFHTDEENSEVPYEGLDERYAKEDKDLLPEDEALRAKQLSDRGRRKPLFITAKKPEFLSLLSRTQSEIENLEAIKYENVTNEFEERSVKEDSKTEIKSKGQKGSKTGKLYTHEEESERAAYEETSKAKAPAKKRDTAKGKRLATPDVDADESISPASQASSTKSDTQTKKQKLHKRERPIASSEISDRNMRPEDQNVQSSSQIQLKKQRSLGGEILTIHFAAPDESYGHLYSEFSSESQAQLERGTTSEDARLSRIPSEYQKKDLSVDNLLPEKKPLIITRNVSQNKKPGLLRDDNAENENVNGIFTDEDLESERRDPKILKADKPVIEVQEIPERNKTLNPIISDLIFRLDMDNVVENKLDNLRDMLGQHLLRNEFKPQSKSGAEIGRDKKRTSAKSKSTAKTDATSKELSIIKGTKLLEQLKDQQDVGLLKIKPQETITTKYHPPKKFPTKVINLSPFLASQEENMESSSPHTDEIQKPLYRTSRGSSGIPATFQQMMNSRKITGDLRPKRTSKEQTELENQLRISITSSKKYVHKGQSKHQKLRKKGAESQSSIRPSASSIKKQKLKEQPKPVKLVGKGTKLPKNRKMPASTPKIKVIKELSKTSHLEGEDVQLSNNPSKSKSAIKKFLTEEPPKPVSLNDQDATILYNLLGLTYATNKDPTKEPTKPSDLDKSAVDILHMSNSALIQYLKGSSKTSDIGKKVSKRSNTLHKSTSSMKKHVHKEPSKTKKLGKNVGEGTPTPSRLTPAWMKLLLKEPSKISNIDKQIIKGTKILPKSNSALKKRVPKEPSKTSNLDKQSIKGTNTLRKSNSALKKRVPKGQPKPTTLDKKGADLPNNLVSSTSASSKHRFKG